MLNRTKFIFPLLFLIICLSSNNFLHAGWQYRKSITINSTGTILTNYQALITLTTTNFSYSNSIGTDGHDLRFSTDSTGFSIPDVNYWIQEWNEDGISKIWLEIPSIPASNNTSLYMFYGNTTAVSTSNGDSTFLVFEDFDEDNSEWTEYDPNSKITLDYTTDNRLEFNGWKRYEAGGVHKEFVSPDNYILEYDFNLTGGTGDRNSLGPLLGDSLSSYIDQTNAVFISYWKTSGISSNQLYLRTAGVHNQIGEINISESTTYYARLKSESIGNNTSYEFSLFSDSDRTTHISGSPKSGSYLFSTNSKYLFLINSYNWNSPATEWQETTGWMDNYRLRNYSANEPTVTINTAESNGSWPLTGPVASWQFNSGTGAIAIDNGGNNFNLSLNGSPDWDLGVLCFDGSDDWGSTTDSDTFSFNTEMSIHALLKPDSTSGIFTVVRQQLASENEGWMLRINNGVIEGKLLIDNSSYSVTGTQSLSTSDYSHLGMVWSNNLLKVYVDGNLDDSVTTSGSGINSTTDVTVGRRSIDYDGEYFDGCIDSISVYSYAKVPEDYWSPRAPTDLIAFPRNQNVFLKWRKTGASDFAKYYIYGGAQSNPTTLVDSTTSINDTTRTITGLTNGTTYYYRVKTFDDAANGSDYSNEISALPRSEFVAPKILSVSSTFSDSTCKIGDVIPVRVIFTENVIVAGTPHLSLETGATDAVVDYTSGTGTDTLIFNYTVSSGDNSDNLEIQSTSALILYDGTVKDAAGNDAVLALPEPGKTAGWYTIETTGFSAGAAEYISLAIDNGTPYVVYQDAGNSNKATVMKYDGTNWVTVGSAGFSAGAAEYTSLAIDNGTPYVVYQDAGNSNKATVMKYDGTSWIAMGSAGFSAGQADYLSFGFYNGIPYVVFEDFGNNFKATVMKYDGSNWVTVGSAGFSPAQAYFISLAIDNGIPYVAFKDFGNTQKATVMKYDGTNWVTVGSAGFSAGLAEYTSLTVDNGTPYIAYKDGGTSNKATVMKYNGTSWVTVGSAGFSAGLAEYTSLTVDNGTPYIAYKDGGTSNKATVMKYNGTSWVNEGSAGFSDSTVSYTSMAFNNGMPYVVYKDEGSSSKASMMKYNPGPSLGVSNNIVIDGIKPLSTTLLSTISSDQQVILKWRANSESDFGKYYIYSDTVTNPTTLVDSTVLINDTTKTITGLTNGTTYYYRVTSVDTLGNESDYSNEKPAILLDEWVAPTIISVSSTSSDGIYKIGDVIPISVIFTEDVVVTGTPQLTLETGTTDAVVDYSSGTGTDTLIFNYTVSSGDSTDTLEVTSTSALTLNGGSIKDAAGNDAVLTLPELGKGAGWFTVGAAGISDGFAYYTSLLIDDGTPFLAYGDEGNSTKAEVMKYNGTTWDTVGIQGFSGGAALYTSIGKDNDTIFVAYSDGTNSNKATVMKYNGTTWDTVGIQGFSDGEVSHPSLAIDNGTPFLAFIDGANGNKATVMKYDGTSWIVLGSAGFTTGTSNYISFGYEGAPYVAYSDGANSNKATVMKYNGTNWVAIGNAGFSTGQADYLSFGFYNGIPYVAYSDGANSNKATVMKYNGTNWVAIGSVGFSAGVASFISLVIDDGKPNVAYRDGANSNKATVMKYDGTSWVNEGSAGFSEGAASYTSLAFNNGIPNVAYMDAGNNFKATVMNYKSTSSLGANKSIKIDGEKPSAIIIVTATPRSNSVFLKWRKTGASDFAKYYIYGGAQSNPTTLVDSTTSINDTTKTITGLTNGTTYYYRVTSVDTAGNESDFSNEVSLIPHEFVAPKILSVSSTSSDGIYKIGDVIPISVIFTEDVVVTGTPQLTLETGTTDAVVDYSSGTGTDTLIFNYTVSSGDSTDTLEVTSTSALTLNGGSIKDSAGNDAVLTLPEPGKTAGWYVLGVSGFSDSTASFTSLAIYNGTPYVAFSDRANNDKATVMKYDGTNWVTVGNAGFSSGYAYYTSLTIEEGVPFVAFEDGGNGGKATVMKYDGTSWVSVGSAGFSAGSAYYTSLVLEAGTPYLAFKDGADSNKVTVMKYDGTNWDSIGNSGFSDSTSYFISLAIDNATPFVAFKDGAKSNKATVMKYDGSNWVPVGNAGFSAGQAEYTSLIIDNGTPYLAYKDGGNSNKATVMKYNGTSWVNEGSAGFTPSIAYYNSLVIDNGTPYLAYKDGGNSNKATVMKYDGTSWVNEGSAGFSEGAASFTSLAFNNGIPYVVYKDEGTSSKASVMKYNPGPSLGVSNNIVIDGIKPSAPKNLTATLIQDNLTIEGEQEIEIEWRANSESDFGKYYIYSDTVANPTTLVDSSISINDTTKTFIGLTKGITYYYRVTAKDTNGNESDYSNEVSKKIPLESKAPTIIFVSSTSSDGIYKIGDVIPISVIFTEDVVVTGTPQLTLETGTTDAVVDYSSGTGTDTLIFNYTVESGSSTTDLEYVSISALSLNGGSIADAAGNDAVLTLPELGQDGTGWYSVGTAGFSNGAADYTSLTFDEGDPFVAFKDDGNSSRASVMKYNDTDWINVGDAGFSAGATNYLSFAIDNGTPYVAYNNIDYSVYRFNIMKYNGSNWETVKDIGYPVWYISMAFENGQGFVAFKGVEQIHLKAEVLKFDGSDWISIGNASDGLADYISLAIENGIPYVAYMDGNNNSKATVVKYDGTNWVKIGNAGFSAGAAKWTSLAIDNGTPYVVYQDAGNSNKATTMKNDGTNWVTVGSAGFSAGQADYLSLAIENGIPYVAFQDAGNGYKATVMKYDGTSWVNEGSAGFSDSTAWYTSLDFNNGIPYVAYVDVGNNNKATVMKFEGSSLGSKKNIVIDGIDPELTISAIQDNLGTGDIDTIKWIAEDNIGLGWAKLYFTTDSLISWNYIDSVDAKIFEYNWDVTDSITSTNCAIKIIMADVSGYTITDTSNFFTIYDNTIPVIEELTLAVSEIKEYNDLEILWRATDNIELDSAKIYYSNLVGISDSLVTTEYADSNHCYFSVPVGVSDSGSVKLIIVDINGNEALMNSGYFYVLDNTPPVVSILSPKEDDELGIATIVEISFDVNDNVGITDIDLHISTDGGNTWSDTIESGLVENELSWFVPDIESPNASLRLIGYDAMDLADTSIVDGLSIVIVFPTVLTSTPSSNSWLTWRDRNFHIEFSQPMDPDAFDSKSVLVSSKYSSSVLPSYSYNIDNRVFTLGLPKSFSSSDTITLTLVGDSITNIFGYKLDGDSNEISGDDYSLTFYTVMLADYDTNQAINEFDLAEFILGLENDDYFYELGPVVGTVPNFISSLDNLYDIEDVMAFVMMWNWYVTTYGTSKITYEEVGQVASIKTDPDSIYIQIPEGTLAYKVQIDYIPGTIGFTSPKLKSGLNLSSNDDEKGIYTFLSGPDGNNIIALPITIVGKKANLTVSFRAIGLYQEVLAQFTQELEIENLPEQYALHQNYPNPFNPYTIINYDLPMETRVNLVIYDILGREVVTLVNKTLPAGYKTMRWDSKNGQGIKVSAGLYFYHLRAGKFVKTRKMMLLK